jgi:hypothetical protein
MENSFPREKIFKLFVQLNIGFIEYIHEIPLRKNDDYKRVIIKLKWNTSDMATYIKTRLIEQLPVNLVYDFPFFWHINAAHYKPTMNILPNISQQQKTEQTHQLVQTQKTE